VAKVLLATVKVFLQATPDTATRLNIIKDLKSLVYVCNVHHLHLWSLDGNEHVLTAHLELNHPVDASTQATIKAEIATLLAPYALSQTTIELEFPEEFCRDKL
jgi:cobalt-zinc-cadmium efflux system protein